MWWCVSVEFDHIRSPVRRSTRHILIGRDSDIASWKSVAAQGKLQTALQTRPTSDACRYLPTIDTAASSSASAACGFTSIPARRLIAGDSSSSLSPAGSRSSVRGRPTAGHGVVGEPEFQAQPLPVRFAEEHRLAGGCTVSHIDAISGCASKPSVRVVVRSRGRRGRRRRGAVGLGYVAATALRCGLGRNTAGWIAGHIGTPRWLLTA